MYLVLCPIILYFSNEHNLYLLSKPNTYQHEVVKKFLMYFTLHTKCGKSRGVRWNFCL